MLHKFHFSAFCILLMAAQTTAQTGQWQTVAPSSGSPTARNECSYVQAGNKFYLLGGRGTRSVQAYDPATNSWTTENSSSLGLNHFQAVSYNGKVYVASAFTGNCCHEVPVSNIQIFDPATKQWSIGPQIPSGRRRGAAGCVVYNNKIYVVCGITDGHSSGWVAWLDRFDPQTNTWVTLANAPRARDHFNAVVANGKIYCMGGRRSGYNGSTFNYTTAEVDIYDIASNTWSTLPSSKNIPTQRAAPAAALLGNDILIAGGETGSSSTSLNKTEAFNIVSQSWRTVASLNQGRNGTSAIVYNNKVYVVCGAGNRGGGNELNTQEVFSFTNSGTPDCNGVAGGTAFIDDCGVCSGGNTGHVANSNKDACGVCFGNGSSCGGSCQPLQVTSLTIVRTGTAGDIGPLTQGMTINLGTTGPINIRANICPGSTVVKSVKFVLNGSVFSTESTAPYALAGDSPAGNYKQWNVTAGNYTLTATPYNGTGGSGTAGIALTVSFTVTGSAKMELIATNASSDETFRLYPNPNTGQFIMEMDMVEQHDVTINIYNPLGQTIYYDAKQQFAGKLNEPINLDNQPSGIYFLKLTSGNKVSTEKIIISN